MLAPRPAAGAAQALFELLLGPANAALSGGLLLGVVDPADELVACQRGDVLPGSECCGVGDQCLAQVRGQLVHDAAGYPLDAHGASVIGL